MIMKRFYSLMLMALMAVSTLIAADFTVIVMDTTQALLPQAQLKIGRKVYTTSFDGRVVLSDEQVRRVCSMTISCEGYETLKIRRKALRSAGQPLLVVLTPKKHKASGEPYGSDIMVRGRSMKGEGLYLATMAMPSYADRAVPEMAEAEMITADMTEAPMTWSGTNDIAAGKLTAGEVNDFAKWYFWPTVLDSTHVGFAHGWQIAPRHRYVVQVMNSAGYPIASQPVALVDQNDNTIFQAVTDNTGKAELWYQLIGRSLCGKHADFFLRVADQRLLAHTWEERPNTFVMDEECADPSTGVDVFFVFDATGSMGDELRYLQAEMKDVIARASEATDGLAIRTGAVVYRDHGDEYLTRISRLTEDIAATQSFISRQEAGGGGDYEEAVPEALMAALNSAGWDESARARIAFLILDAPCHQDSATLSLLHDQILNAAAQGVRIVPVVCSGIGESGEYLMRAMALATNGTSFFLTDDSGIGAPHLKPTTDSLKVEHLNDMLVRTIVEFSYMPSCSAPQEQMAEAQINDAFLPNPFEADDLTAGETALPQGEGICYLVDISGKLISVFEADFSGSFDSASLSAITRRQLPVGVYFLKTYSSGRWFTRKLLVH